MEFLDESLSLSRSNLFSFDGNSNTSLSNLLDKGSSIQDYLDVSIDLNSVFDLRSSTPERSVSQQQQQQLHNTINTPTPPDPLATDDAGYIVAHSFYVNATVC